MKRKITALFFSILCVLFVYCLKENGGLLTLYDFSQNEITPLSRSLESFQNEADKKMLKKGIILENQEELTKALEDFCS